MMLSGPNWNTVFPKATGGLVLIAACMSSCRHNFAPQDLVAYHSYNSGDTIIFQSSASEQDTFVITSKSIQHHGLDANTGLYSPPTAYVTYVDLPEGKWRYPLTSGGVTSMADGDFMTIYKTHPSDRPSEVLYFNHFIGTIDRSGKQVDFPMGSSSFPVYQVPRYDPTTARDPKDLTHVYWSDSLGMVAYDCKSGEQWSLVRRTHQTAPLQ